MKKLEEKKRFEVKAWLIYRYLTLNPKELENAEYREFHGIVEKYYMKKFWLGTDKNRLKELFKYESEQPIIINKDIIEQSILEYKQNPELLASQGCLPKNGIFTLK